MTQHVLGTTGRAVRPPTLLETSVPGMFAVGDVRQEAVKRVAAAAGEGSVAIGSVQRYLAEVAERPNSRR